MSKHQTLFHVSLIQTFRNGREEIELETIIVTGADCYEAMTEAGRQRPEWTPKLFTASFEGEFQITTNQVAK